MQNATLPTAPISGPLAALSTVERIFFGYLADYHGETRKLYEYHLNRYFTWCTRIGVDPLAVDRTYMSLYVRHLSEECGLRGSTVNTCMTPVKGFYGWAIDEDLIDRDPTARTKLPKSDYRQKYPLEREELRAMRSAAKRIGGRHWALTELLIVEALRISEASSVLIENFQDVERGHHVLTYKRKGGTWRTIPLPVAVLMAMETAAGDRTSGLLVTRLDGGKLSRPGAAGLVRTVARHAGIKRPINPHLLRGSAITETVDREGIREGQRLAGHEDPRTTSRHYDLSKNNHDTHPAHLLSARLTV